MATRPKAVIESRNGEEFSPITIAKNVLTDDGQNLHDILSNRKEEEDMITPTIENSSSMFKVGQGDNVDYSSNVVNGAYESMVLKGKTMVNCIQEPSSQDVVLPYEFEDGQYVTINDTKESGALGVELKGQTLVNLYPQSEFNTMYTSRVQVERGYRYTQTQHHNATRIEITSLNNGRFKPNTNYYVQLTTKVNKARLCEVRFDHGQVSTITLSANETKVIKVKVNSGQTLQRFFIYFRPSDGSDYVGDTFDILDLAVLEHQEGMENWDIPYFEGMASCKMPTLHTVGNLFDAQKIIPNNTFTYSHSTNIGRFEFTNRGDVVANTSIQLPAGTYDISFSIRGMCDNGRVAITFAKDGQAWHNCSRVEINYGEFGSTTFKEVKFQRTFDAPVTVTLVGHGWAGGATGSGWCEFKDIRFTPVGKTSILSLPEEVVLRSLPNGVCDTFNTRTGVYAQRIGEIVLNGSEVWNRARVKTNTIVFYSTATREYAKKFTESNLGGEVNCDNFSWSGVNLGNSETNDIEGCYIAFDGNICIAIAKSKLTSDDISSFKQYLQSNPTTVQYELETPVVTKINLPSTLKSWNTKTHIYSEIPENTLHPILSHSNPSYPVILKPSTKYSIIANSYSNNHTNSTINFNLGGATASTTVGNRVTTITTPSTLSNELLTMSGRGNKLNNVMVIEGDVVGDEPYFEGMCDSKSPILSNIGKNLLDIRKAERRGSTKCSLINNGDGSITLVGDGDGSGEGILTTSCYAYLKEGKTYTFSFESDGQYSGINGTDTVEAFLLKDGSASEYVHRMTDFITTFTCGRTGDYYIRFDVNKNNTTHKFWNIQLTEGATVYPYEPYKSNILSCETYFDETTQSDKTIVLRSIPNGVCDTLNVETGEYVQRIGETSNFTVYTRFDSQELLNTHLFTIVPPQNMKTGSSQYIICDKFSSLDPNGGGGLWDGDKEGFSRFEVANYLRLRILKSKCSTVEELRAWLQSNPITIQYELTKPIVSTIDVQGFPYAYTNGHVQLSSGHSGQSLTPKVEYSVVTNRNGQIRSNQKMVERHQKQLDRLQAMILTNLVNTQYEQTLTNLRYDLKNVREEVK